MLNPRKLSMAHYNVLSVRSRLGKARFEVLIIGELSNDSFVIRTYCRRLCCYIALPLSTGLHV